ncbi:MAG: glycosyltransferase family 4 protein [Candidatus Bathyarchaeia archaeon]
MGSLHISLCHHLSLSYWGGGEKYLVTLAKELSKRGHQVEVYGLPFFKKGKSKINPKEMLDGIPYEEGLTRRVSGDVCYVIYRPLVLLHFKTNAPKIAGIHSELFWKKEVGAGYGLMANIIYDFNKFYRFSDLKKFDAVHLVTNAYPIEHQRVYFIPNFVDSQMYYPCKKKNVKFTVAYTSRKVWQKGWDIFQEVTQHLSKDIQVKISGGVIPEKMMPAFLSEAHVTVVPARVDTFGLSIIESLLCGTPVITTSLKTHKSLDLPLIYADSPEEFLNQIMKLKAMWETNPEEYKQLCLSCRESAMKYDKTLVLNKLEKMFEDVAIK